MGEAKARLQRLLEAQPRCVYCGESAATTSRDHCPPIAVFDGRQRPKGLEFGACDACHQGTREMDAVVASLSRLYPAPTSDKARIEVIKYLTGLANNHPNVARIFARHDEEIIWEGRLANVVHVGQEGSLHKAMNGFAARMALALFREVCGFAAPMSSAIVARWYSNYEVADGQLPLDFINALGPARTLSMGDQHVWDQFRYVAARTVDGPNGFGYAATFRQSFAISGAIWTAAGAIDFPLAPRPGFLRGFSIAEG